MRVAWTTDMDPPGTLNGAGFAGNQVTACKVLRADRDQEVAISVGDSDSIRPQNDLARIMGNALVSFMQTHPVFVGCSAEEERFFLSEGPFAARSLVGRLVANQKMWHAGIVEVGRIPR
jgi:hypothetical protein